MATNQMRREAAKRKLERQQERRIQQARRRRQVAVITSAAVVVVVLVGAVLLSTLGGGEEPPPADPAAAPPAVTPEAIPTEIVPLPARATPLPATVDCTYGPGSGAAARPVEPPNATGVSAEGTVPATLTTSAGPIPLTLDRSVAPCTVNSFVSLVEQGYFDGTPCHRLTTDPGLQVLQCGDPTGSGTGGPGYTTPDELYPEVAYGRGILAMAKSAAPNSGGSQFFVVYGDGDLPPEYTAFGTIGAEGLEVVDGIARAGHDGSFDPSPGGGAPIQPVTIESATVG